VVRAYLCTALAAIKVLCDAVGKGTKCQQKKWEVGLIRALRKALEDPAIIARFRVLPTNFTRQRAISFKMLVMLILQGHKQSLQNTLNKWFKALDKVQEVPTASALCQARQKLKPEVFLLLNRVVVEQFYELPSVDCTCSVEFAMMEAGGVGSTGTIGSHPLPNVPREPDSRWDWLGHRVLGADGTCWNLPDTPENREHFGSAKNQHDYVGVAQSQGIVLYDVLNDIGINAVMEPIQAEKALMFKHHLEHTEPDDVIVMDRGFAAYSVLAFWAGNGRNFLVRLPRNSFGAVRKFWKSSARETVITLHVTPDQRAFIQEHNLPRQLQVRLIKITLITGEEEMLATSLLDAERYQPEAIGQLYAWRWRTETYIDRLKNIFEIERMGSRLREHLLQDFYGVVFLATLESVLTREANRELAKECWQRGTQYVMQVNRAVSYSALMDQTLMLLTDPILKPERVLRDLRHLFKTNPIPKRPGRKFDRIRRTLSKKLRFHQYTKKSLT